jgi:hypothetical protein
MKFFKRHKEAEEEVDEQEQVLEIKYVGGHKAYPKGKDTAALIYPDRIEIAWLDLIIPYSSITNVRGMDDRRITKTRAYYTGPVGLFWKKNYIYTVIDYNDGLDDQSIVIDFHRSAEEVQKLIYQRMISARKKGKMNDNTMAPIRQDINEDSGKRSVKDFNEILIQKQHETNSGTRRTDEDSEDPLKILKIRLAKGQITKAEYEEMRKIIESQ